jgi:hypothetical protein
MPDYQLPRKFDPLIHQPARLAIMALLAGCASADFSYLLEATDIDKGSLSKHLSKLEDWEKSLQTIPLAISGVRQYHGRRIHIVDHFQKREVETGVQRRRPFSFSGNDNPT